MNRREFLKKSFIGLSALAVAPVALLKSSPTAPLIIEGDPITSIEFGTIEQFRLIQTELYKSERIIKPIDGKYYAFIHPEEAYDDLMGLE